MPIEEITLSVPDGNERNPDSKAGVESDVDAKKLEAAYLKSARARDRFTFTNRGRARNRERFNQSLKALVKGIATSASNPVEDRRARMAVRTQVYAGVVQLANAMSKDQLAVIERSRKRLRWSLGLAIVGVFSVAMALAINDLTNWPPGT